MTVIEAVGAAAAIILIIWAGGIILDHVAEFFDGID